MTRARFILGDDALRQRFDAVRNAVISATRDAGALQAEIVSMRERVRAAHPLKATPRGQPFDVKHSPGGMIDIEFAMQFLVLANAAQHPELLANAGNIALLERAETLGLLPAGVGHAGASAYREMRRLQHQSRLNEEPSQVFGAELQAQREAGLSLWRTVFEAPLPLAALPA